MTGFPQIDIEHIRRLLAEKPPKLIDDPERGQAAVALLLRSGPSGLEVLFIQRAQHPQDPWSGNIAFPGGRIDPGDAGARQAAERETLEEVGLDLTQADYLGRLDDIVGTYLPVQVACFVYAVDTHVAHSINLNHEVSELFFFPLDELGNPDRHVNAAINWNHGARQVPAINLLGSNRPLLWGITYRLICQLLKKLGAAPKIPFS